jgi:hypothetical protein
MRVCVYVCLCVCVFRCQSAMGLGLAGFAKRFEFRRGWPAPGVPSRAPALASQPALGEQPRCHAGGHPGMRPEMGDTQGCVVW